MEELEKREKNILKWAKDPHQSFIIALFIVVVLVRLYYFFITIHQPVWWDEGDYLNVARMWAFGTPHWDINPLRPLLFPFIISLLFKIGSTEIILRIIELLFSIAAVILTYFIGKELYNRETGLIGAFMLSFFWSFLFFSYRILVDVPVATLWLLALFLFIKGYEQNKKIYLWFFGPALIFAFLMKFTAALLGFILLAYLLITERIKPFKNKQLWGTVGLAIVTVAPFLYYEFKKFGHPFAFYTAAIGGRAPSPRSLFQTLIDYINTTFPLVHSAFLILFIVGFAIILFEVIIGFDLLLQN